ncbi:putative amine GPCR [Schistosoma japonicum]|uniref:Putative amine GPCR n=1 Tax=Schistosoma japonicum TaxID=6182 RepID=A0A4Z2DG59_SCHJA|nr:putative amine GPCR [Schistosoma japonicum]
MLVEDSIPLAYHIIAGIVDVSGIICNVFTLIFISFTKLGSRTATVLFRTQCGFDGMACFIALFTLFMTVDISKYNGWFAVFLCRLWISEYCVKSVEMLNVSNLMWISIDRFCAVYLRAKYKTFQTYELFICYTFILCYAIFTPLPLIFTVEYVNTTCKVSETIYNSKYANFVVYNWLVFAYVIPSTVMIICYTRVYYVVKYSVSRSQANNNSSSIEEKSTQCTDVSTVSQQQTSSHTQITSSSFRQSKAVLLSVTIMCTLFVLSHAYFHIYSLASLYGIIEYYAASLQRRLSVFFTVINSSLNPIILLVSSQQLRRKLIKTIHKFCHKMNFSKTYNSTMTTMENSTKTSD